MSETQAKRLSKVASELGVGIPRIVEFLEEKGFDKVRPNTKIDPDTFQMLEQQFIADKQAKEKSVQLSENKVVRETISIESQKSKPQNPDSDKFQNDEIFIRNISEPGLDVESLKAISKLEPSKPELPKVEKTPEVEKTLEVEEQPVAEEKSEVVETPKAEEAPIKEEVTSTQEPEKPSKIYKEIEKQEPEELTQGGPKVLARINLDDVDPRAKKRRLEGEQKKKEALANEEKKKSEKAANDKKLADVALQKEKKDKASQTEKDPAKEHIDTKVEKLTGITLLGKIEIKEEPKKKRPIASSSPDKQPDKKKKRKRIAPEGQKNTPNKRDTRPTRGGSPEVKKELTEEEIQNQVRETLARLSGGGGKSKSSKHRKAKRGQVQQQLEDQRITQEEDQKVLKVTEFVTVSELSSLMNVSATEVIGACMSLGLFVSINQRLDSETITVVSEEFGYSVEFTTDEVEKSSLIEVDNEEYVKERPPIVTIMGHVDHGKTSLLDYIRKANVIAGEAGGITQHIGAYTVETDEGKKITFLDTPGHEAFTAMRARGAQVTDVVIIVIAADDRVMPQTKEAINHAQAAGVPMIFAFNKMDKDGANSDKLREELSQMNILVEDWGGKFQSQEISAKHGTNVDDILEKVLLEAELLELKADANKRANGAVLEASLDKGKGYVTTILVQSGTLKIGDMLLAGSQAGRVKAMFNERGQQVKEAGPSTPVTILGLSGAPNAGDSFVVMQDEREAKEIANKRLQLQREQGVKTQKHITLDEIGRRIAIGDFQELNIIVKGDVDGSVEALSDSLINLSTEQIQVNIIHKSVGQVSESDVLLATASNAIIIGFQVRPSGSARKLAEKEEIEIRSYSVIYDAIDEVKAAMEGMLAPKVEEKIVCNIEIRETFKISKVGTIAGCYVLDGKVHRNTRIRLIRDGVVVYTGELGSLKRFKDDVKEVSAGYECGLNIQNFNDVKVGDIIEGFEEIEIKQTL